MVNPGDEPPQPVGEQAALLNEEEVPMVDIKSKKSPSAEDPEAGSSGSGGKKANDDEFVGLTKEELEKFANDPFWRRLRLILFILFWVVWFGMLAAVIAIIVISPKCPPRPQRYFWQKPFYRVQVRSFAPTSMKSEDADKLGTVAGLRSKLPYLTGQLGLENFMLDSLVARAGSGCPADFSAINANLSSEQELRDLTKLGRKKGYQFLMDFDPTQADDAWADGDDSFLSNDAGRMMISRDRKPMPPAKRLRTPRYSCSSLNVSSPTVVRRLRSAMTRWLDAGLSGFVLTNVAFLAPGAGGQTVGTFGQLFSNASVQFVADTRQFLDAEADRLGRDLALFVDVGDIGAARPAAGQLRRYALAGASAVLDTRLGRPLASPAVADALDTKDLAEVAKSAAGDRVLAANWPYLRRRPAAALTALSLTLPGVPLLYYGQELGMAHVPGVVFKGEAANPSYLPSANESTDASETPMQWSSSASAGWLPNATQPLAWAPLLSRRADDIRRRNLLTLNASGHPQSSLQLVSDLLQQVAGVESLQWGELSLLPTDPGVVAFARKAFRFPSVFVVLNVGKRPLTLSLADGQGELLVAYSWDGAAHSYAVGEKYPMKSVYAPSGTLLMFLGDDAE